MKWEQGRQGGSYLKMSLAKGNTWDLWLLKYPPGSTIRKHRDRVTGKSHYRINVLLAGEQTFMAHGVRYVKSWLWGMIVYFRPDITPHEVLPSIFTRYVLSLGWVK